MGKDVEWKSFFQDNHRYADIINGIGCGGVQLVKDTDLAEADLSAKKKSRDMLRNMYYDVSQYPKQASAIRKEVKEGKEQWDGPHHLHDMLDFADIPESLKELVQVKDYSIEGKKEEKKRRRSMSLGKNFTRIPRK